MFWLVDVVLDGGGLVVERGNVDGRGMDSMENGVMLGDEMNELELMDVKRGRFGDE